MKIVFTKHAIQDKTQVMRHFGWVISRKKIINTVKEPRWKGRSNKGQPTAMSLMGNDHILLVVYKHEDGIIKVITFYVTRRGRYGSTL